MRTPDATFYSLRRMHVLFAVSSLALLAATVWMVAADHWRPWRQYQRTHRQEIEQIWLPELTIDYHFRQVARFDRCTTCHQGIDKPPPAESGVEGGLAQPYASHPRLDLFLGAKSPHPKDEFGCTACHDGQGSATDFSWASHSPDDPAHRAAWRKQHGWSANPHWDYPMLPRRLGESLCLKCHLDVSDLEPSRRLADPPAPKLLAGYHLVRRLGCFGCHEINGYDSSGRRVGPDLRLEPDAAASASHGAPPGAMRKVGLTLAELRVQTSPEYVYHWLADPTRVRPGTRMPRLFGLDEHLDGPSLADTARLEAVELRAATEYLFAAGQPVPTLDPTSKSSEPASSERGKQFFQTQGCLGCHAHTDFPAGQSVQGPNLTGIGTKYVGASGHKWLESWIRDPVRHAPRTKMPRVPLDPGPVADIAAWLLQSVGPKPPALPKLNERNLNELTAAYLSQVFPPAEAAASVEKKLQYVGRFTIRKRGCAGCHDVPGLDDAPPIGPSLAGWGRKQTSLLLFGQVDKLLGPETADPRQGFFRQAVLEQRREGFAWQKLAAPRSFDYQPVDKKPFNEQLRMGRFALADDEREAIVTFLTGLVAEPPTDRYLPRFDARRKAIVAGRKVIDAHGCGECHTLDLERWRIEYKDRRGLARAELVGMPRLDARGKLEEGEDDDGNPTWYFGLWEPASLGGRTWPVGGPEVVVGKNQLLGKRAPWGGALARLLFPIVVSQARASGSTASHAEAWGWLPPPLVDVGRRVQPAWLHEFLLAPRMIHPAAVLRMPKFNLSDEEARKLADYFAARSNVEFPYVAGLAGRANRDTPAEPKRLARAEAVRQLVLDRKTFCAKCHLIGDSSPGGENKTVLAPNLEEVGRRIRPEYLRRWLADPKTILPYTPMPVNFPPSGQPRGQDLLPGTSQEQLDAVVDFLVNYEWYQRRK